MAIVNYQILNIGELLYLLPCNLLRNNVRAIEKLNKSFINAKYIYIYIYSKITQHMVSNIDDTKPESIQDMEHIMLFSIHQTETQHNPFKKMQ